VRRALRVTGWVGVGLALAGFLFVLWASLRVRQAVDEGAFTKPVYSCISRSDTKRLDAVSKRAFVRGIQQHLAAKPLNQTAWHWHGLVAYVGTRISYTEAERVAAMRPMVTRLTICPR
jgi:hypothetical protein